MACMTCCAPTPANSPPTRTPQPSGRRRCPASSTTTCTAAATAADTLYPSESGRWHDVAPPDTPAPPLVGPAAARAWLDAERPSLVAVATHAADHGWPDHAIRLAATLFRYLDVGGHYPERVAIHTCA